MRTRILFNKAGGEGGGTGGGQNSGGQGAAGGQPGSSTGGVPNPGASGGVGGNPGGGQPGGSPDPLFGSGGGGPPNNGNPNPGNQSAGAGNPNGAPGGNNQPVVIPDNWKEALPPELRDDPTVKMMTDIPTLAKTMLHAQKMIGADKIVIPGKNASEEDWKEAFHKLGNPRSLEQYNFEVDKETETGVDKEFLGKFKEQAWKMGVLPKQAQSLVQWMANLNKQVWSDAQKANDTAITEGINGLRSEWGNKWDTNLVMAKAAIKEFADEPTAAALQKMGLGTNPTFLKMMAKVGETLAEDKIKGHGSVDPNALTPDQALVKIREIEQNPKDPYWDPNHPNHQKAKKEYTDAFAQAYPTKKTS